MERIRKIFFTFIILLSAFLYTNVAKADELTNLSTLVTPQTVNFEQCTKRYNINPEKLFYLTLASINANRFQINELQTKTGYILFSAVNKDFLASVVKIDSQHSVLKITPVNNNYYFAPGIVMNMFKYIDLNINTPVTQLMPKS